MGDYGRYQEEVETLEADVRHEWEQYSLEVRHACREVSEKLEGKTIWFRHSNTVLKGKIIRFTDQCGSVNVEVRLSEGICDVALSDVVRIGRRGKE